MEKEERSKTELENQIEYQRDIGLMYRLYTSNIITARRLLFDKCYNLSEEFFQLAENNYRHYQMMRNDYKDRYFEEP